MAEEAFAALNTRDEVDLESPQSTFQFLCTLAGESADSNAQIDIDDVVLAFQQFFNDGIPLDPDCLEELKGALGSVDDEDVSMTDWSRFHKRWLASTVASGRLFATAVAHLEGVVERKKAAAALEEEKKLRANQQEELEKQYKAQLEDFKQELQKVRHYVHAVPYHAVHAVPCHAVPHRGYRVVRYRDKPSGSFISRLRSNATFNRSSKKRHRNKRTRE